MRQKSSSGDNVHPYLKKPFLFWRVHPDRYTPKALTYYEACEKNRVKNDRRSYVLNDPT
jgi:hypothetical protein